MLINDDFMSTVQAWVDLGRSLCWITYCSLFVNQTRWMCLVLSTSYARRGCSWYRRRLEIVAQFFSIFCFVQTVDEILFLLYDLNLGSFHKKVILKLKNEIVFDKLSSLRSFLLLAAIGAKFIGPHCGLQVDKQFVMVATGSME